MNRRALGMVALAALVGGCAGGKLRAKASTVDQVISKARDNGAERCAPVELAMAESHHAFAVQELDEGDYYRAKQELAIAEKNAGEALEKSPRERCIRKQKKKLVVTDLDTDGDGILDKVDKCPKVPEDFDDFEDEDGCPELDNDKDGLNDDVDKCPNVPEDKDGFEDDDGCPELDNDKDGLNDDVDKCPDVPEDKDGFEDDDGCPDCDNDKDGVLECPVVADKCPDQFAKTPDGCPKKYNLVVVTDKKIEIKQTIFFDTAKSTIKPRSYPLLNEVAQALKDNATIKVRVEGHTDSRGSDRYNLRLSDSRAASVRTYLIGQGVDSGRMVSKGYGERVPIADNRSREGRSQNRRVEFVITDR